MEAPTLLPDQEAACLEQALHCAEGNDDGDMAEAFFEPLYLVCPPSLSSFTLVAFLFLLNHILTQAI